MSLPWFHSLKKVTLHEEKSFFLVEICEKDKKDDISLVFLCFRLTERYFMNFPANENVRTHHLSANVYSYVNVKFLYTKSVRKDGFFCCIVTKIGGFWLVFSSYFCWHYLSERMKFSMSYCSKNKHLLKLLLKVFIFSL